MAGKKRKQISNKQILMITLTILGAGILMLVASILLAPAAEAPVTAQPQVAQSGTAQSSWGVDLTDEPSGSQSSQAKPSQSAQTSQAQKPTNSSGTSSTSSSSSTSGAGSSTSAGKPSGTSSAAGGTSSSQQTKPQQTQSSQQTQPAQAASKPAQSAQSAQGSTAQTQQNKPSQTSGQQTSSATSTSQSNSKPAQQTQQSQSQQSHQSQITHTPTTSGAKLVFVFDDAGHNLTQLEPFLKLPFKADIAVLPSLPHSADAAAAIRKAGKEVMLHQPMQAVNLSTDPGPSAITPDMHTYEIEALVRKNIAEIGPIKGLNNHEGSLITATQSAIGAVLDVCQAEGIFFLDSRTNSETKAPQAAQERGMKIYERDIFLDNSQNKKDIIAMVEKGLAVADKKGHAIMIGHVWSDGLAAILEELYPELVAKGYVFTDISGLK